MSVINFEGFSTLNFEQQEAFVRILDFVVNGSAGDKLILSAFAGSGKTYLLGMVQHYLRLSLERTSTMVSYTGRAASLLDGGRTCHSLLYEPIIDLQGNLVGWNKKPKDVLRDEVGIAVIIDEGSMLPKKMCEEIESIGVPVIYSGDIAQLPPIDQDNPGFNVMERTDIPLITLSQNMRIDPEAAGIFAITEHLREHNSIPRRTGPGLKMTTKGNAMKIDFHKENMFDVIICGTNRTRKKLNDNVRKARGFFGEIPEVGERVICLKNDVVGDVRINNGELFDVSVVFPGQVVSRMVLTGVNTGKSVTVHVPNYGFDEERIRNEDMSHPNHLSLFAFGYCISCHKSQGGTFDSVLFIDEDVSYFLPQIKYRYTGVSRAAKNLTIAM